MNAAAWPPAAVTLSGQIVRLEPMQAEHGEALAQAAADPGLSDLWFTAVPGPDAVPGFIETALSQQAAGRALPFVVREQASGTIVGSTRFMNIEADRRRLEIGTTWYVPRVQRTGLNTEAKWLLLAHAFEGLGCIAVEFRTHFFNFRSRTAIAALGARQDGILRQHMRLADGSLRDTVVFSIIDSEWPTVNVHLRHRLARLARLARLTPPPARSGA
jgi:N-acetyltransferase